MSEQEIRYVAEVRLNEKQLDEYIKKAEQLTVCLEKARDLLRELQNWSLKP